MDNLYYNEKRLKKIKNKRTARTKKIWGWILTILGGLSLIDLIGAFTLGNLVEGLIFLVLGLLLIGLARKQVSRWDQYEAIIDNHGNTSIPLIADRMGLPKKKVYEDLQNMIHSDFFIGENYDIEAYVDAEREMLVMTHAGRPLKPLPDREEVQQEDIPEAEYTEEEAEEVPMTDLDTIRQATAQIRDEDVRNYLYGLEGSLRRIDARLSADPEIRKKTSIKRLYKYYLPQIMELIKRYQQPETPVELKHQIRDALRDSAGALATIEADLMEKDQMHTEVDIEVLKNMFAQDGLLGRTGAASVKPGGSAEHKETQQPQVQ